MWTSQRSETSTGLLQRLRIANDATSWDRFIGIYTPYLYGWLRRQYLRHEDVEDLVQDTLRKVSQELPRFQHNGRRGAFRCWLRRLLINRLREFQRSQLVRTKVQANSDLVASLAEALEDPASRLSRAWDHDHDRYVVRKLMELIQPEFQAQTWRAFQRVALDAADPDVVANELGISVESVYAAKSRVLKRLHQESTEFLQ
jgi:RNA polymerase sigma-70 factor (ECF subfamily)